MKNRIDVIAGEESYNNLSSFTDIEEMNETIRTYRDSIRASIKRADVQARLITLLELLKRHSCKYVGVSFLCKNSIAEKLELSYKTIQRLVKKLEDLGMIKQVEMKRKKDMLQTANSIIILPVENVANKNPTHCPTKCPANKTTPVSLKQKIKRLNTRNNSASSATKNENNFSKANFVAHWVPAVFAKLANYYYNDAKTIQELWKVVKQNNRIVDHIDKLKAFNNNQELSIGLMAIKELVMKIKDGKGIKNIFGYFNGIVDNLMSKYIFNYEFMNE
ncbi:helix-turn-helix domain-containing protein [Neobacillus mesonae]|uniref:helix-turn-helix domain-containing protein n=1 Tax=Neobacillus mesonae TaxID=1193713 RepID=UPI0020414CB0|nr:helix-turn-helix domain-containing protein [Neobacillus mesonae]MCM3567827.1 helix-turn-helix domain-containing protein [Neobacillus mesonae]